MPQVKQENIIITILPTIIGLVVGLVAIIGMEVLESNLFPLPEGYESNPLLIQAYIDSTPVWLKVMELITWAIGTLTGSTLATFLARTHKTGHGLMVGVLLLAGGLVFMEIFRHPLWFWISSMFAFLPFSYLGSRIGLYLSKTKDDQS